MQPVLSRNWTRIAVSISCDDNHYTTGTSFHEINRLEMFKYLKSAFYWLIKGVLTLSMHHLYGKLFLLFDIAKTLVKVFENIFSYIDSLCLKLQRFWQLRQLSGFSIRLRSITKLFAVAFYWILKKRQLKIIKSFNMEEKKWRILTLLTFKHEQKTLSLQKCAKAISGRTFDLDSIINKKTKNMLTNQKQTPKRYRNRWLCRLSELLN